MRILLIFPLCPLPLHSGGQVRVWNIARELSKYHEIDLVCFIRKEEERKYEAELKQIFKEVTFIQRRTLLDASVLLGSGYTYIQFFIKNIVLLIQTLFSDRPVLSLLYKSDELKSYILANQVRYDLLYAETFYGIASLKDELKNLKKPLLLIEQNIESKAYARQSEQRNWLIRFLMHMDIRKIEEEQEYYWKNVDLIGGLSKDDGTYIAERSGREPMILENGVDVAYFAEKIIERREDEVLFVGAFKYFQNIDAVTYLLEEIWPELVRIMNRHVSLRIVGRGASDELKRFVEEKGHLIDEQVEDIREAFQRAALLIAPIRAGSGTNYKIIEALASDLPVVTTSVGAEGFEVKDGEQMMIGDEPTILAAKMKIVLESEEVQKKLAENGSEFVQKGYDWKSIVQKFNLQLEKVLGAL